MNKFPEIDARYDEVLRSQNVPQERWSEHQKWVRFYLHFCEKYGHQPTDLGSMPPFIAKLASKGQTVAQQAEAQRAIGYYAGLLSPTLEPAKSETAPPARVPPVAKPALAPRISQQGAEVREEPGTLIWQEVADKLKE